MPFGAHFSRSRRRAGGVRSPVTRSGLQPRSCRSSVASPSPATARSLRAKCIIAAPNWTSADIAGWASRLRSRSGSATSCRTAATSTASPRRSKSSMAAIELIEDLGYDYGRLDAAAMIAGNVWNAGAVLGEPVSDWRRRDLALAQARLSINGRHIGSGIGADVMGHPINALAWLANSLAAAGTPLKRGMIVMTGSMVPIQYPTAGDRVLVEVSGLGTAELAVM